MRDVEKYTLELIEYAGQRGISLFQCGLAIEPIFLEQVFSAALLTGDVHLLLPGVLWPAVSQLDQNHFRPPEMLAHGHDQNALANFCFVHGHGSHGIAWLGKATGDKRGEYERGNSTDGNPAARCEPLNSLRFAEKKVPPVTAALRQARGNLL